MKTETTEILYQALEQIIAEGPSAQYEPLQMSDDPIPTTEPLPISPMVDRAMNRFHAKLVERRVNERLGGDATVCQLVELMMEMGWQPPHHAVTKIVQDV